MAVELIKDRFALLTLLFGHEDTASNKVCSMIKLSKKHQYSEILNENANNPASVWKLFKEIGQVNGKGVQTYFLLKPVTMSLKIQKILLMNSINFL